MFIYMLRNKQNGKCYVGLTEKLDVRLGQHRRGGNRNNDKTYIAKAIKKYGWDSFDKFVLEQCESIETMQAAEKFWIAHYNCVAPTGYNLTHGGERFVLCQEARQRRSNRMKGHAVSDEARQKISAANTGRKHTLEWREETSRRQTGRKMPESFCEVMKAKMAGDKSHFAKLTWEVVRAIRADYAAGDLTQYDLAPKYNVSVATISRVVRNKIWIEAGAEVVGVDHRFSS